MSPTQVTDWQTQARVGGPPIGKGSSFDVTSPLEPHLKQLADLRDDYPALSTGASVVRLAQDAVLVVSRIDEAAGREVVAGFNNSGSAATVTVPTATPGTSWHIVFGTGTARGGLTLTIPPVSAVVAVPSDGMPKAAPRKPKLSAGPDALTEYTALTATAPGEPVSVWFAIRRKGGGWQRVAVDDSAPYRAFVDPLRFPRRAKVDAVAVARGLDGTVAVSPVVTFTPRP
jgi:hypothetical protein